MCWSSEQSAPLDYGDFFWVVVLMRCPFIEIIKTSLYLWFFIHPLRKHAIQKMRLNNVTILWVKNTIKPITKIDDLISFLSNTHFIFSTILIGYPDKDNTRCLRFLSARMSRLRSGVCPAFTMELETIQFVCWYRVLTCPHIEVCVRAARVKD